MRRLKGKEEFLREREREEIHWKGHEVVNFSLAGWLGSRSRLLTSYPLVEIIKGPD